MSSGDRAQAPDSRRTDLTFTLETHMSSTQHPLPAGTRVIIQNGYEAVVQEVGVVPQDAPCERYRGLPGYRVQWLAVDERAGRYTGELEPDAGPDAWVVQAHCRPV